MLDNILQVLWPRTGLIFNFLGTIFIAFSFGKNPGMAYQQHDMTGREIYLASFLYPRLFKVGIIMVIIGFFLQLIF